MLKSHAGDKHLFIQSIGDGEKKSFKTFCTWSSEQPVVSVVSLLLLSPDREMGDGILAFVPGLAVDVRNPVGIVIKLLILRLNTLSK
jgi:hypothetical protein